MRIGLARDEGKTYAVAERDGLLVRVEDDGALLEALTGDHDALMAAVPVEPGLTGPAVEAAVPQAPVRPGKVVAIGLNYLDHIRETGMDQPEQPLVFAKFPSSIVGPGAPIVVDRALAQRVDWEVELAVVIGRRTRDVPAERALEHVLGYTIGNDVSARDVQFGDGQWVRGKSFDSFCPLGPLIVTPDEIGDPQGLPLRTRVNEETVQDSNTSEMVFGVAELLAFCSRNFTLDPGDVVMTGTPWGCGEFMDPPRSLQAGDVVSCEIEGIGSLVNPVEDEAP